MICSTHRLRVINTIIPFFSSQTEKIKSLIDEISSYKSKIVSLESENANLHKAIGSLQGLRSRVTNLPYMLSSQCKIRSSSQLKMMLFLNSKLCHIENGDVVLTIQVLSSQFKITLSLQWRCCHVLTIQVLSRCPLRLRLCCPHNSRLPHLHSF